MEQPRPSLGEEMNKLLASMDPQGLLNMTETEERMEENTENTGVDPTKSGDAHAAAHEVSLTDNGSESGSSAGSTREKHGNRSETMEVSSPNFRIVDIEPKPGTGTQQFPAPPPPGREAASNPDPAQIPVPPTTTDTMNSAPPITMESATPVFAIPSSPRIQGTKSKGIETITGKNIFSKLTSGEFRFPTPNSAKNSDQIAKTNTTFESYSNMQNTASGFETPPCNPPPLPTKKPVPVEPDAVPSKIYDAILTNKNKKEKAGTIGGIASGQGPTQCGSFFNKGDNRVLRSVYREDVNSLSISSLSFNPVTWKCSSCPTSHSVLEPNSKGGRCVIVLADQNFPAVLPSGENRCLAIIRLESGSLDELIDLFLKISRPVSVPEGTVVLFGSLTTLSKIGLQSYASACINGSRRISGAIKGSSPVPFVPPLWVDAMILN
jgi:hypothetical protein